MTVPTWTPETFARRLARHWPDLTGETVTWLGEGSDHRAYAVGDAWVFRVPTHAGGAEALAREARLLAWLEPHLPLPVPRPRYVAGSSDAFPQGVVGASRLSGEPGIQHARPLTAGLGHDLGAFLRALHDQDGTAADLPVDHDSRGAEWQEAALDDLAVAVQGGVLAWPEPWAGAIAAPPALDVPALTVIHGDLAAEHVLLDPAGRACGVIDWTDAALGDPARDLTGVIHWGGRPLLDAALTTYGAVSGNAVRRAAWFALCRALGDLAFGVQRRQPAYVRAGHAALEHLADGFAAELDVCAVDKPPSSP